MPRIACLNNLQTFLQVSVINLWEININVVQRMLWSLTMMYIILRKILCEIRFMQPVCYFTSVSKNCQLTKNCHQITLVFIFKSRFSKSDVGSSSGSRLPSLVFLKPFSLSRYMNCRGSWGMSSERNFI